MIGNGCELCRFDEELFKEWAGQTPCPHGERLARGRVAAGLRQHPRGRSRRR